MFFMLPRKSMSNVSPTSGIAPSVVSRNVLAIMRAMIDASASGISGLKVCGGIGS